jgi:hypothetical protein
MSTDQKKTVGIVADDYKLDKFKKELANSGFTDISIKPFTPGVSSIKIVTVASKVNEIKKICQKVEMHFKQSN